MRINNHVTLIGNLGADPEVKEVKNGRRMARFSLATNEHKYALNHKPKNITKWHKLIAWGEMADIIEKMLKKGKRITVEGRLSNRMWEDKNGEKHYCSEIIIQDFTLIK